MDYSRISSNSNRRLMLNDVNRAAGRVAKLQSQMASGKRLERPSDGPADTTVAINQRATLRRIEQYAGNASEAGSWLGMTDQTLMDIAETITQARVRAGESVNGALDPAAREAIAKNIEELRDSAILMANTRYGGRPLFSGTTATDVDPYTKAGVYQGNDGAVTRTLADGLHVQVNVTGEQVFGAANAADPMAGDLFQVLGVLADKVRSGDANAIGEAMGALEKASNRVAISQVQVGARTNQVEDIQIRNGSAELAVKSQLNENENIDFAEAIVEFRAQEAAYEAALTVTARAVQTSLVNFLR